jgi:hypothetical protein
MEAIRAGLFASASRIEVLLSRVIRHSEEKGHSMPAWISIARGLAALIGCALLCSPVLAGVIFNGLLEVGEGEQCQGKLLVTEKIIEWKTPFGHCQSRYALLNKTDSGQDQHRVYRLISRGKRCLYGVVALSYQHDYLNYWNASWYRSIEHFKQDDEAFVCPVVRFDQ